MPEESCGKNASTTNRGSYTCGEWVRTTWGESPTAWDSHTSEHSKASASGQRRIREDHHLMAALQQTPPQGLFVHYLGCCSLPSCTGPRWPLAAWRCIPYYYYYWHLRNNIERWVLWEETHSMTGLLWCFITRLLRSRSAVVTWGSLEMPELPRHSLPFSFLSPNLLTSKKKKGNSDAWSWTVQLNGHKPDLSHAIKSS